MSLELFVHVSGVRALDVVEALQLVSGDHGLLVFVNSHSGRIVGSSFLKAGPSAQNGGLDARITRLSAVVAG